MLLKKISFLFPLFLIISCSKIPRPHIATNPSTCITNIQYSTCSASEGCTLTFSCELPQSSQNSALWTKIKSNIGTIFSAPVSVSLNISSLTINQPSLLQASAGEAPTTWYNNSIDCIQDGNNVTCATFSPIASDFTITGTLGNDDLTLDIIVNNDLTPAGTMQCGQQGTTVQRMFDCSQRVANYAGFGNGTGVAPGFTAFVPGNPDPNWFLVSCPGTDNQQCFWLSPVMSTTQSAVSGVHNAYPALADDEFDTNGVAMSSYNGGRFLWSGISVAGPNSDGTYNFFQANGNNPYNVATPYYNFYAYQTSTTMASLNAGGGPIIYRPQIGGVPPSPIVNSGYSGIYGLVTDPASVCTNLTNTDPVLLKESVYQWQMPSYPMIMTLTGGYSTSASSGGCEQGGLDYPNGKVYCNIGSGPSSQGFRAIDTIPGFNSDTSSDSLFWSSSVYSSGFVWLFFGGGFGGSGSVKAFNLDVTVPVRCVSAVW